MHREIVFRPLPLLLESALGLGGCDRSPKVVGWHGERGGVVALPERGQKATLSLPPRHLVTGDGPASEFGQYVGLLGL